MGEPFLEHIFEEKPYWAIAPRRTGSVWHIAHGLSPVNKGFNKTLPLYTMCRVMFDHPGVHVMWNPLNDYLVGQPICQDCLYAVIAREA